MGGAAGRAAGGAAAREAGGAGGSNAGTGAVAGGAGSGTAGGEASGGAPLTGGYGGDTAGSGLTGGTDSEAGNGGESASAGETGNTAGETAGGQAGSLAVGGAAGNGAAAIAGMGGASGAGGACFNVLGRPLPGGEICNGEDDDCDGAIDEDFGTFSCGLGACRLTVAACSDGHAGSCVPPAPATSIDACNGVDDDCDGAVDEDCSDCVHVASGGNDTAAALDAGTTPFGSVQAAIDFAATLPPSARRVCVAPGASCGASASFPGPSAADLLMRDGVSVFANYASGTWARCSDSTTTLVPSTARGVVFPASVTSATGLDGFSIQRFTAATTAGVTVDGATGAVLSNLTILDGPAVTDSYGVNVVAGATATVVRSRIDGGRGANTAIGVRASGGRVLLDENCPNVPGARCDVDCASTACSIRGKTQADQNGTSIGVLLRDAAGSRLERSAIAAFSASDAASPYRAHAVELEGDATATLIRASSVYAAETYDQDSSNQPPAQAIGITACGAARPWIVDNASVMADGNWANTEAIGVAGDCHPLIDWNLNIVAGTREIATMTAVHCAAAGGVGSRCVIANNQSIRTTATSTQLSWGVQSYGVRCDASCSRISGNRIAGAIWRSGTLRSAAQFINARGLVIDASDALVDRNQIAAGCSNGTATGMRATGAVTIVNNQITGLSDGCGYNHRIIDAVGLSARAGSLVDSNYIDGGSTTTTFDQYDCELVGLVVWEGGTYTNNVIRAGHCPSKSQCPGGSTIPSIAMCGIAAATPDAGSDLPAVLAHNSLVGGDALYRYSGLTVLHSIEEVNAQAGPGSTANVEACGPYELAPAFRLLAGSTCIDAGGATQTRFDRELEARDALPDIGPDEYH
jgi:hypothetical protein